MKNFLATLTEGEALEELGFDATELAKRMQVDARGAIIDVMEALSELPEYEQSAALSNLFGEESKGAIAPLLTNLDALRNSFDLVAEPSQYAGSMLKEYAVQVDTTEKNIDKLMNTLDALAIVAGSVVLPEVNALIDAISPAIIQAAEWARENEELVAIAFKVAGALFGVKILTLGLSFAFVTLASPVVKAIALMARFRGILKAVTVLMATNPITATLLAIAAAAYIIYDNWDNIVSYFQDKIDRIKTAFDVDFIDGIMALMAEFNPFQLLWDTVAGLVEYLTGFDLNSLIPSLNISSIIPDFKWSDVLPDFNWDNIIPDISWPWQNDPITVETVETARKIADDTASLDQSDPNNAVAANAAATQANIAAAIAGGRDTGGPVRKNSIFEVGERGPELFVPPSDGHIVNLRALNIRNDQPKIDFRPSLRSGAGANTDSAQRIEIGQIVIQPAAGMDERDLARMVRKELENVTAKAGRKLHDGGAYS